MVTTCVWIYLAGWVLASVGVYAAGRRICESDMSHTYHLLLSAAAGLIWPLLLVGAAEFTSVAMYSSAEHYAYVYGADHQVSDHDRGRASGVVIEMH